MVDAVAHMSQCAARRAARSSVALARPRRLRLCAAIAGVAVLCLVLGAAGGPGREAAGSYRPGGLALRQVGPALNRAPLAVDGCLRAGDSDRSSEARAELARLFAILAYSAAGRAVLDQARRRDVHVCIDEQTDLLAYYFAGTRVVGVSAGLSEGGKIAFLAHELGHVPQHPAYSDNRLFPPRDLIRLRRVREAAAEAIATRIAWELRERGHPHAWNEKATTPYGDVARAFEEAVLSGPSETAALRATRAAFDRWFEARWRRDVYDRMTVDHLERISADDIGLVPPRRRLSHAFLEGIARLDGRNFLAGTEGRLLTDPFYLGGISVRNEARLQRIIDSTMLAARSDRWDPLIGLGS